MYAKEITNILGEIFEVTPENRFHVAKFLSDWPIDFKILDNGSWLVWRTSGLIKVDESPTAYFYNGKFWNKPQKADFDKLASDIASLTANEDPLKNHRKYDFPSGGVFECLEKNKNTLNEIGERLKATNTAKQNERITQLEKQLSETKLENENLGRRLIKAYLEIDRLTTI